LCFASTEPETRLAFYDLSDAATELKDQAATTKFTNGLFEAEAKLKTPALSRFSMAAMNWQPGMFHFPDRPPSITIMGRTKSGKVLALHREMEGNR
jgi:hypothetical protein